MTDVLRDLFAVGELRSGRAARDAGGELARSEAGFSTTSAQAYSIASARIGELETTLRRLRSEREGMEGQIADLEGAVGPA